MLFRSPNGRELLVGGMNGKTQSYPVPDIVLEAKPGKTLRFPFERVEKANLKFEW